MEESEQRRERLKTMRMEAAEGAETHNAAASSSLGNPLVETARLEPSIAPRFDFYTDPMSAFSGRTKVSHQTPQPPRPMNPPTIPEPYQSPGSFGRPMGPPSRPQQGYMNDAPGTYIPPGSYQTPGPFERPMGPPSRPQQGYMNDAPGMYIPPGSYQTPGTFERPMGPPSRPQRGYMNNAPGTYIPPGSYQTPGPFGRPVGPPSAPQQGYMNDAPEMYGFPSNSYQGGNFRGPSFVQSSGPRGAPYHDSGRPKNGSGYQSGRGRGHWRGNNHPGHWRGNNHPGQRQGGRGPCDNVSDEFKKHLYYDKSMIEDPWKDLKPTLWRGLSSTMSLEDTPGASKSWLPESIGSKKARVSKESVKYAGGKSFAEALAESFHAAKSSEAHDESTEDNS